MNKDFKYLTHNSEDKSWGFYLTVAGCAKVLPGTLYPPVGHPSGYDFTWENGRVLQEYQINYITEGEGIMETHDGVYDIKEGSVIILKPGLWHRYRPLKNSGWVEHYVGFNGETADKMIRNATVLFEKSVIKIGFHENIIGNFQEILNHVKTEKPGYHQICSGLVIYILGQIISMKKSENFRHNQIETAIQKACLVIRDNQSRNINIQELACNLDVNYTIFRKAFKKYTGLSPVQYHTSLRIKQAAFMLINSELSVKEISFNLGFCSVYYFSKLFREKMGITPGEFRKKNKN